MTVFSKNIPRMSLCRSTPALPDPDASSRRDGELSRRHSLAVLNAGEAPEVSQGIHQRVSNGFQWMRSLRRAKSLAIVGRPDSSTSNSAVSTPIVTPVSSPNSTPPIDLAMSSSPNSFSGCAIIDDDEPLAEKAGKKDFSHAQVQEALQNLTAISAAAEGVSERLKVAINLNRVWRYRNVFTATLDTTEIGAGQACGKCEAPPFARAQALRDRKKRVCTFCSQCGCASRSREGLSTAPEPGSSSGPCFAAPQQNMIDNDVRHLSLTHIALSFTLERLVKDSKFSSQRNMLKIAETLSLASKFRETIGYWLDLERVLHDWGWVIPPPAFPNDWEEAREHCRIEIEKSKIIGPTVLQDYNARLFVIGPCIRPEEIKAACLEEQVLSQDIALELKVLGLRRRQELGERQGKLEREEKQERKKPTNLNWAGIAVAFMRNRLRGIEVGARRTGKHKEVGLEALAVVRSNLSCGK
ncbi:hypothetical protein FN846DRAFT_1018307 [Sphaerosporella brunnea]|uniref:Uncharacterized protein n=1 Tax=Sphaerosporella brunnea TaxID=1250544 RepID=A0A5J5FBU1_9PEZI|nr:hypothetical protein FN846DRAFT_1018307 [Sphaerosporella brunnea]